jgi:hypothetical protein
MKFGNGGSMAKFAIDLGGRTEVTVMNGGHIPNVKKAVEELAYMIEKEERLPSSRQDREVVLACRSALEALTGTRQTKAALKIVNRLSGDPTIPTKSGAESGKCDTANSV